MIELYRGLEIRARREKNIDDEWYIYYSVIRLSDGREIMSGGADDGAVRQVVSDIKATADKRLSEQEEE